MDNQTFSKFWKNKTTPEVVELIGINDDLVEVDYGLGIPYLFSKDIFFAEWEPVQENKESKRD